MLDGIDLDVEAGDVITLIGASGSGKSTLLRCINLLEPVDDGTILFDGVDIAEPGLDADPVRRRIGMIFQSFNLFPHMSVTDNVAIGPRKVLGDRQGDRPAGRARRCSPGSGWRNGPTPTPTSCPAASSSASPSPGRWRCTRR